MLIINLTLVAIRKYLQVIIYTLPSKHQKTRRDDIHFIHVSTWHVGMDLCSPVQSKQLDQVRNLPILSVTQVILGLPLAFDATMAFEKILFMVIQGSDDKMTNHRIISAYASP